MQKFNGMNGVITDSFSGSASVIKNYPGNVCSLAIANDGKADVVIDLGYCQITVKSDEVFDDNIVPMRSFTITATDKFRCLVRGEC
jgi:hypothetical protein